MYFTKNLFYFSDEKNPFPSLYFMFKYQCLCSNSLPQVIRSDSQVYTKILSLIPSIYPLCIIESTCMCTTHNTAVSVNMYMYMYTIVKHFKSTPNILQN